MATLKGVGAIFGVSTNATAGIVIAATCSRTGADFTWDGVIDELENSVGEVTGCAIRNTTKEITITVIPASTTVTLARGTEAVALLKTPGTAVTITCTDGVTAIPVVAGAYMLLRSRFRETNTGFAVVECDVKQWAGITEYADKT